MTLTDIKNELKFRRGGFTHATYHDLAAVLAGREKGDYTAAHATRLYKRYGTEYCQALEVIEALDPTPVPETGLKFA